MKLYNSQIAPSPRRVRIFLAEKGIDVERVEIDIAAAENLSPAFLAINPRGVLPTLLLDDGGCLDESSAICRYFEEMQPEPPLMGTDAKSKAYIESRSRHMEFDGFLPIADVLRNSASMFARRGLPGTCDEVPAIAQLVERGRAALARFYAALDGYLGDHEFIAGPTFSFADITALCVVDFSRAVKQRPQPEHGNIQRWYQSVSARPSAGA